jgi:hypothetical protein
VEIRQPAGVRNEAGVGGGPVHRREIRFRQSVLFREHPILVVQVVVECSRIVRIHAHLDTRRADGLDGILFDRGNALGPDVAGGAEFEDDAAPRDLLHEGGIPVDLHPVAEAFPAQVVQRAPDGFARRGNPGLPGVHRQVQSRCPRLPKQACEWFPAEVGLVVRQIHAHERVPVREDEIRDLGGRGDVPLPPQDADQPDGHGTRFPGICNARQDGGMDRIEGQVEPLPLDEDRRIAQFQHPDTFRKRVFAGLPCHPLDPRRRRQHLVDHPEFLEEDLQSLHRPGDEDEIPELGFGGGGRQEAIRQHPFLHGGIADGAFDMAVEFDLGHGGNVHRSCL